MLTQTETLAQIAVVTRDAMDAAKAEGASWAVLGPLVQIRTMAMLSASNGRREALKALPVVTETVQ